MSFGHTTRRGLIRSGCGRVAFFDFLPLIDRIARNDAEQLGKSLLTQVRAIGISANVAVSENFHTAAGLAKGFSRRASIQVVASGEEAAALSPLPLTVLAISGAHLETFASWGIYRLGELAATS
jgi:hypothetical protein